MLTEDTALLGFVDSAAQFTGSDAGRVLTMYFCFTPAERKLLAQLPENRTNFVKKAAGNLDTYFGERMTKFIDHAIITPMGHAMPIPVPGHLLQDANTARSDENMAFAGVDNGRLPLMFEAMDSGLMAARLLQK